MRGVKTKETYSLLDNSRFYLLVFAVLLSVAVFCALRLIIESDRLLVIRSQQYYGLICLVYWYIALVISPISHIVGKQRMGRVEFARRAIGVSAFYFAVLHAAMALFGQLGGIAQLGYLPGLFQWSLAGGAIALGVLAVMAATSFDAVVRWMTYRKWKWLHRLIYVAGVLVILHVWTIGTHLAYTCVQLAAYGALVLLIGLGVYSTLKLLNEKYLRLGTGDMLLGGGVLWVVAAIGLLMMPQYVQNYHSRHVGHGHAQERAR